MVMIHLYLAQGLQALLGQAHGIVSNILTLLFYGFPNHSALEKGHVATTCDQKNSY